MNLVNELLEHCNNENIDIINNLCDFIINNNINSKEELFNYQENYFKSIDNRIEYCKKIIFNTYDYDYLNINNINKLNSYLKELKDSNDEKLIIKIFNLLEFDLLFVYDTYNFIINDKL